MESLFDAAFAALAQVLMWPLLFVVLVTALKVMAGEKPDRAFASTFGTMMRVISGICRFAVRLITGGGRR